MNETVDLSGVSRVLTPTKIGTVTIPNRVVRTAHYTGYAASVVNDRLVDYHLARARGGVGLSFLEATAVHQSSVIGLRGYHERCVAGYESLMTAIRPTGMRMFVQLWHGGHHYDPPRGGPPRGASWLPSPIGRKPAVALQVSEIDEICRGFGQSAAYAVRGGLDGIEIHGGHGYLVHQFLSPLTNTRDDLYGGSSENRSRLLFQALAEIREAVGTDVPLGVRLSASREPGGVGETEIADIANRLVEQGLIDYLDASLGDYYDMGVISAGMESPAGYQLESTTRITARVIGVPRIVTGRFRTLEEAEQVIRSGEADFVSMVRAHIADPDIVAKTVSGNPLAVRPCIGCNQGCIAHLSGLDNAMSCVVNPSVGFEPTMSETGSGRTTVAKRVVVVGGGPAGMEAARMAAVRGHDVVLFEAQGELGGTLRTASRAPKLQGMLDFVDWQMLEMKRLNVTVKTHMPVEVSDVLAEWPDHVVLATGAEADLDGIFVDHPGHRVPGIESDHVVSSVELLTGQRRNLGQHVVVFDEVGHYEGVAVVEFLLERELDVSYVTTRPAFGQAVDATTRMRAALARFSRYPTPPSVSVLTEITEITRDHCVVRAQFDRRPRLIAASTVVIVGFRRSRTDLFESLAGAGVQTTLVGDALSARDLQVAVREGYVAGRSIE